MHENNGKAKKAMEFYTHIFPNSKIGRILEYKNGISILKHAYPREWRDLIDLLESFVLKRSEILAPGGRKSSIADQLDGFLYRRDW